MANSRQRLLALAVAAVAAGALAPAAVSQEKPPPSAVSQYMEEIPTSGGSVPGGGVSDDRGNGDAGALEKIVTSPEYGAPSGAGDGAATGGSSDADPGPLSAAIDTASEGSDGRVLGVVLALIAIAAVAAVAAAVRLRSRGRT